MLRFFHICLNMQTYILYTHTNLPLPWYILSHTHTHTLRRHVESTVATKMEVIVIGWDDMASVWCWSHVSFAKLLLSWSCESLSLTAGRGGAGGVLFRLWREDLGGWAPVDAPTCCWYLESCLKKKKEGKERKKSGMWHPLPFENMHQD